MGFKDLMENTILRMDLLSCAATFRTRKQPTYETIIGGIFSFLVMGTFYYFLYMQLSNMLNKLTITYSQGLEDDVTSTSSITEFPFAISIDGVDLSTTPRKFMINLYQTKIVGNSGAAPTVTTTTVSLSPCNVSDWADYGSNFKQQLTTFGFTEMLCIGKNENISLKGYAGSEGYDYLTLQINQCNQTLDSSCDTYSNINSYMSSYIGSNDYFKVRFFVVDTIITPTNDQAISKTLQKNIFMAFSSTIGTVGYLNMAEFELVTDTNLLPVNSYETVTGSYIEKFVSNAVSLSTTRYVNFNIYRSTKTTTISRTMGKIDTVLSYVGGLFSLLFTAIAFFLGSYGQYKYELYVAESIMTDDKGSRVGADDLTWYNYFFYCCYDWMDSFGIAPKCLTKLKGIHDMREESCEQLDPAIILKRIKYVEDVSKILLKQHREMCLYLSEPLTLGQAKKMRGTLLYYDSLINEMQPIEDSKKGNENEKFLDFGRNNAIQNDSGSDSSKPIKQAIVEKEAEKQLSEEEQKAMLDNLICSALSQLQEDNTEEGQKIRKMIPERMREWIRSTKKCSSDLQMLRDKQLEMIIPSENENHEDSNATLQVKEDSNKSKINIKKARR